MMLMARLDAAGRPRPLAVARAPVEHKPIAVAREPVGRKPLVVARVPEPSGEAVAEIEIVRRRRRRRLRRARRQPGPARPAARRRAQAAVEDALKWLAAHQSPNGGWEAAGFQKWCDGKPAAQGPDGMGKALYDPGVTGLALCAFLGAGYTNRGRHPFAKTVSKGLRYLKNIQDPEGCFGPRTRSTTSTTTRSPRSPWSRPTG